MKEFIRMVFQTINFGVIAVHAIAKELPVLVVLAISELKKLFEEDAATTTKSTSRAKK